jgi:hypothetical protein
MTRRGLAFVSAPSLALLGCAFALAAMACSGERADTGPGPADPPPTDPDIGNSAPVNLTYVCGNRFVISNARTVPITVTYRVTGTEEEGAVDLAAAPRIDPALTERTIELHGAGAVQLFLNGRLVVTRQNEGAPCSAEVAALPWPA